MYINGGRPLRSIGPTNLKQKEIFNALQRMTPDERVEQYILVNETTPEDENHIRLMFNKIFHEYFNSDALRAREIMVSRMVVPGTVHIAGFNASNADINRLGGGKTRRNRRRRGRRSLKRKHSRRR